MTTEFKFDMAEIITLINLIDEKLYSIENYILTDPQIDINEDKTYKRQIELLSNVRKKYINMYQSSFTVED